MSVEIINMYALRYMLVPFILAFVVAFAVLALFVADGFMSWFVKTFFK